MPTAKEVLKAQGKLNDARATLGSIEEHIYYEIDRQRRAGSMGPIGLAEWEIVAGHPDVKAQKEIIDALTFEVESGQKAVGGKVFRIAVDHWHTFEKKMAKVNRKAAKLGCEETTYYVAEEEEEVRGANSLEKRVYNWNYTVLNATKPMIPGYRFIAALDHTVQSNPGDPVIVKQVPSIEDELDLAKWRHADARCEHCNKLRSRNTTYLVEEIETHKISKVGSSCLADFTGSTDPERFASYLEYLHEIEEEISDEEKSYSGRKTYDVITYLTHVAACIRESGWNARSGGGYATADKAWSNIFNYGKKDKHDNLMYVPLADEDRPTAEASIEWAKGLEGKSDFEHNLKTMASLTVMPAKGDGIVAYIVQGYVKDESRRIEREAEEARKASAEKAPKGRTEVTGIIVSLYTKEGYYGNTRKMTVVDDRGFKVNGSVPQDLQGRFNHATGVTEGAAKEGDKITFTASLEPKESDDYYAYYKRPTKATIVEKEASNA